LLSSFNRRLTELLLLVELSVRRLLAGGALRVTDDLCCNYNYITIYSLLLWNHSKHKM